MSLFLEALKEPKYFVLAVIFTVLIMGIYAFLQVLPQGLNNYWFWFSILTPNGWLLYSIYGIFFGTTLSFFFWQRSKKVYPARKITGGFFGALGSFLGTTAPVCAGCLPWAVLLFPTSFASAIVQHNSLVMVFSIALLFFALWLLGGFQKYEPVR